jgi:hypothetical protein
MKSLLSAMLLACAALAAPAQAATATFTGTLLGSSEVPPVASPGSGSVTVTMDNVGHTLTISLSFADLLSPATAAHIHCCTAPGGNAGVAIELVDFPNTTSGSYSHTFDTSLESTYGSAFLSAHGGAPGAEGALFGGLTSGHAYVNIHDALYPAGEVRALLAPVPEPATAVLTATGLLALGALARRRRG